MRYSPLHSSGIDAVDSAWGGVYRGGAYLFYGEAAAGRNLLTLLFAKAGHSQGEQTFFISSDRYSELIIQSGSLGFDLEEVLESGTIHLIRIPPRIKLRELGDDGVAQALHNLVTPFKSYLPKRIIINDFMPFVAFRSFDRFRNEFVRFLEETDAIGATLVLAMPEPANEHSQRVIDFMSEHLTGCIHLERDKSDPGSTRRKLTLFPIYGHIKRYTFEHWDLEDIVSATSSTATSSTATSRDSTDSRPDQTERPGFSHKPIVRPDEPIRPDGEFENTSADSDPTSDETTGSLRDPGGPEAIPLISDIMDPVELESMNLPVGSGLDVDITNKADFISRLERAADRAAEVGDTFMLLALRLEKDDGNEKDLEDRALGFEFILDVVHDILRPHDDMLADMEGEQVTVLLAHASDDDTDRFFQQLRDQLIRQAPQHGQQLLSKVSAIVAKNGEPFASVSEFVEYAFVGH